MKISTYNSQIDCQMGEIYVDLDENFIYELIDRYSQEIDGLKSYFA